MPPFVPRKRSHSPIEAEPQPPTKKRAVKAPKKAANTKPTLFEAVDSPKSRVIDAEKIGRFLDQLGGSDDDDSLSDADSDDFEDVPATKRVKINHNAAEDDDEEIDWEDAIQEDQAQEVEEAQETEIGDISVSLKDDGTYVEPLVSAATGKKGPSKRERHIRVLTHTLHVQTLMWHNTVRNSWLNDSEVQKILIDALSPGIASEITRWKRSMGKLSKQELEQEKAIAAAAAKKKTKTRAKKGRPNKELKGRDWSYSAEHTEVGNIDLSHGDPLFRLLKMLAAYWRKRSTITAPGIRKRGYMPLRRLREELKSWEKNYDDEQHGERINSIKDFRELARACEGSRDVGAQLFVALLRGIGLEVRMVANLQPAGFGWSRIEEASAKSTKVEKVDGKAASAKPSKPLPAPRLREILTPKQMKKASRPKKPTRASERGNKAQPINLDDSESSLSDAPSDLDDNISDDASIVDVTTISKKQPTKKYDRDLPHPVYWAEVLSPATNRYIPVDPIVLSTIASNDDLLQTFEPRGSKADKGKQVICYAIAFEADGTAKDVTIRYLKRHQLPGKTKGVRMPVEKVPIYNRKGKVKKYEDHDWFSELMLYYRKLESKRTKADELEEETDLKPFKPSTEEKVIDKESLAWYKSSAEFVLADHLRREEALLLGSQSVKTFTAGKGDKAKEYLVYKRDDVVNCKTVESWHKEGRELISGEQPLKYVPIRAVTLQRKREIEDAERETGEKLKQGLYSQAQTDWIVPPPIVNGVIPRNAFGNMDVYVPTMVPAGAIHLPMKGTMKICKRLEIDYAEACTGFEFGNKRAVPVITGVVVAKENAALVRNAWKIDQAELKRKEDVKRTATALHWWRKMLMGIRIIDRMRAEYTNTSTTEDEFNPFVRKVATGKPAHKEQPTPNAHDEDTGGGFLLEDDDQHSTKDEPTEGGFLIEDDDMAGGFEPEDVQPLKTPALITPISLQSMHDVKDEPVKKDKENTRPGRPRARKTKKDAAVDKHNEISLVSDASESEDIVPSKVKAERAKRTVKQPVVRARVSPTKSPYFSSQEAVHVNDVASDSASAEEVVNVRKTTARTRRG